MIVLGRALVMGSNVNTDELHPSQFYSLDDNRVRAGLMQAAKGYEQVGAGDLSDRIILAGDNFGCGSSRETGARVFVLAGVRAVVARSLARIFSRNLRNLGVPALECPTLPDGIYEGSGVKLDLEAWRLYLPSYALDYPLKPLDPFWQEVAKARGLMSFLGFKDLQAIN
jgi:3-isopropylmalate/(R)-2-methylmalate dehydratase small subunit